MKHTTWRVLLVGLGLWFVGCGNNASSSTNTGDPDAGDTLEDTSDDTSDDGDTSDDVEDTSEPPPAPVPGQGISAGGNAVSSDRFRGVVVVSGPSPAARVQSPRFNGGVGVTVPQLEP